jgi:CheY-like chemotaxis protein
MPKILWIEDDSYALSGLLRPLQKEGYEIVTAKSALEGYELAQQWPSFDLIVVDLILPLSNDGRPLPGIVAAWNAEAQVGVGILKWLFRELHVTTPVLLLSVVRDPIQALHLQDLPLAGSLAKRGLLPSSVKEEVHRILEHRAPGAAGE